MYTYVCMCYTVLWNPWEAGAAQMSDFGENEVYLIQHNYVHVRSINSQPKCQAGGHWPFSVHFSKMADQTIKQDTF